MGTRRWAKSRIRDEHVLLHLSHGQTVRAGGVDDTNTHTDRRTDGQTDLTDTYSTPGQLSLASLPPGSLNRVPASAGVKAGCCHCRVAGNTVSVSKAHNSQDSQRAAISRPGINVFSDVAQNCAQLVICLVVAGKLFQTRGPATAKLLSPICM